MNISLNWLRDYVAVPDDIDALVGDARRPRHRGRGHHPRRRRARRRDGPGRAHRAPSRRRQGHPRVDRRGDGAEHHVWCGASNFAPGDVVPLATVGTTMPDGRTIGSRGILGIPSEGMLCSARELGLGSDHSGILVLPPDAAIGVPYGEVTGLVDDVVFDVDVTRNRPDAFGHVGVARDLAAKLRPAVHAAAAAARWRRRSGRRAPSRSSPESAAAGSRSRCSRASRSPERAVDGRTAPAVGQRPINNVVDVSNYVMLELNQPNHAYDLATLGGGGIRVRLAADGEAADHARRDRRAR